MENKEIKIKFYIQSSWIGPQKYNGQAGQVMYKYPICRTNQGHHWRWGIAFNVLEYTLNEKICITSLG